MSLYEERYFYQFYEILNPRNFVTPPTDKITIQTIYTQFSAYSIGGDPAASFRAWLASRLPESVDNSLINAVLAFIQAEDPFVYIGKEPHMFDASKLGAYVWEGSRHFLSWLMKTAKYYDMRASLLSKTATELLAQVQSQIITERKTDTDTGKDVTATSDMPVTETFSDALASPSTLADKISELNIAQRDYSHKWKDQVDTKEDRFTLPERIQTALDVWDDMVKEWADAFLDEFSIAPSEDWEEVL